MTARQFARDALGWGAALWLFGYLLSIVLFAFLPPAVLGWVIMPFGFGAAVLVLARHVRGPSLGYYIALGMSWTLLAIALDYPLIVRLLHPADGYYKLDVFLYYALTLLLPMAFGTGSTAR